MMLNVLIVDDEEIERIILKKYLKGSYEDNCNIYEATNGKKAIEIATNEDVQVVIMDISMPVINGIEAAKKIKILKPNISIIFLTAHDEFSYAQQAISVHAIDYILKPCSNEELLNAVDEALIIYKKMVELHKIEISNKFKLKDDMNIENIIETDKNAFIIKKIRNYIHENYRRDISMQEVAREMNYSEVYFCKLFKNSFNVNFTTYLTNIRIKEAKRLLKNPSINIKDIGIAVGYSDSNYFAKVFKRSVGMNPSDYRNSNQD